MDTLLSSTAAAKVLGVAPSTVKRWADDGLLTCVKTAGGHRRFSLVEVQRFHVHREGASTWFELLPEMTPRELDGVNQGVIQLDDRGGILQYNRSESDFSGFNSEDVLGKNFFVDVAPCTNNRLVYGRFREGVREGLLDYRLPYTFTYVMDPTLVTLNLYRHRASKTNWLVIAHDT
jgi:photoactive yellow protein